MPYENLYHARAAEDLLHYTISVRKAALLIALDNDDRDQSEIEPELPNAGDYAAWMSSLLEPSGKLKAARDHIEKSILRALDSARMEFALCARTPDDRIDPAYSLVSGSDIERWCHEHNMSFGDWWAQWHERENEVLVSIIDEIVGHRMPAPVEQAPSDYQNDVLAEYRESEIDEREALFRTVLSELDVMKRKSSTSPGPENLGTRERNTLLTVIASLVMALGDRLPDGYKRAEAIAGLTDQLGASVSVGTIDKILKQTAAAVDRRRGS